MLLLAPVAAVTESSDDDSGRGTACAAPVRGREGVGVETLVLGLQRFREGLQHPYHRQLGSVRERYFEALSCLKSVARVETLACQCGRQFKASEAVRLAGYFARVQ